MAKIPVKTIWIRRAEGPTRDLSSSTITSFEAADSILRKMAHTAPSDGSYNKTDFKIEWMDYIRFLEKYEL